MVLHMDFNCGPQRDKIEYASEFTDVRALYNSILTSIVHKVENGGISDNFLKRCKISKSLESIALNKIKPLKNFLSLVGIFDVKT